MRIKLMTQMVITGVIFQLTATAQASTNIENESKSDSLFYYIFLVIMSTLIIFGILYSKSVPRIDYGKMSRSKYIRMHGFKSFFKLVLKNLKIGITDAIYDFGLEWYWYILKIVGLAWALDVIRYVARNIFGIFPQ